MSFGTLLILVVLAGIVYAWWQARESSQPDSSPDEQHYTGSVERIKHLKREGRNEEAAALLLECIEATEAESNKEGPGWGVAPWYYWHLAIVYRKMGEDQRELEILERFARQEHAPGSRVPKLLNRLKKVRARVEGG